jgi:hypothetical protein
MSKHGSSGSTDRLEGALHRVLAEIHAGLRHGHFEYTLSCDVIGQGRRRLLLRAGKHYQFVIAADECESAARPSDPCDRGAPESSS